MVSVLFALGWIGAWRRSGTRDAVEGGIIFSRHGEGFAGRATLTVPGKRTLTIRDGQHEYVYGSRERLMSIREFGEGSLHVLGSPSVAALFSLVRPFYLQNDNKPISKPTPTLASINLLAILGVTFPRRKTPRTRSRKA